MIITTYPVEEENEDLVESSQESEKSFEDFPEESINIQSDDKDLVVENEGDLHQKLIGMIQNHPELNRQALMYEPLWLEDLFAMFKESLNGVPVKINQVQDILDSECITFRTRSRQERNVKRNAKTKKASWYVLIFYLCYEKYKIFALEFHSLTCPADISYSLAECLYVLKGVLIKLRYFVDDERLSH